MDKIENNLGNEYSLSNAALDNFMNRFKTISIAAYFRAETRGFSPSNELEDWFEAEREIQRHLDSFSS
jgi:hypothetical protein